MYDEPDDGLRGADPSLLILSSLAGGPKHGYAITQDVRVVGDVSLGPGTLYGALARLQARGLIEELPPVRRRRPYRLTARGRDVLHARLRGLALFAETGLDRLAATSCPAAGSASNPVSPVDGRHVRL